MTKYFDSNRTGHLCAAATTALGIVAAALFLGNTRLLATAAGTFFWELWATPDMDHASRSIWGSPWRRLWVIYWRPYARLVKHRSKLSHSLLFGLPTRLLYGLAPLWIYAQATGLNAISQWTLYALAGCAIADTVHMIKDQYGLGEIFFGK